MISLITAADLKKLAAIDQPNTISILMPTHEAGRETRQGPIRFGNLIADAEKKLEKAGDDPKRLAGVRKLEDDNEFWQHQGKGLAVFLVGSDVHLFRLYDSVEETVMLGRHPYLSPIVRQMNHAKSFRALALCWEDAHLYDVNLDSIEEVKTADLPAKFEDLVLPRDPEVQLQYESHHAAGRGAAGDKTAMYHGHGEGEDKIEADRRNYLKRVGDLVADEMQRSDQPLVLMATAEVSGHFRESHNLEIMKVAEGSPAELSRAEMHQRLLDSVDSALGANVATILDRFGTAVSNQQGSDDARDVAKAAMEGRVDTLLIGPEHRLWGTVDHEKLQVEVKQSGGNGYAELTNEAVIHTLNTGGRVVAVDPDVFPSDDTPVVAIYRY